jgi:hypothetical protein
MKTTISVYDFRDAFYKAGRGSQFSYEALELIFDYMEEYEQDLGEEIELDVIGICCDISEASPEDIAEDYSIDISEAADEDEIAEIVRDYVDYRSRVIGTTKAGDIVYVQF